VNLIGEHTDYNAGFVLPVANPQRTTVEVAARDDGRVHGWSSQVDEGIGDYRLGGEVRQGDWLDYVRGVTAELRRDGHALRGFDLRVDSTVPMGSGLASSAALEIAVLRALRTLFGLALDDLAMALLAQRAENGLVGAPVGIMDQMAATFADERAALFLDTRSLAYERVSLPSDVELLVIDSGIRHQHAGGEYRARRAQCERACQLLGVEQLRDLSDDDLPRISMLSDPLGRRVRHVVTENQRVLDAREALLRGDLERLGALLRDGHKSLRDDFEVSTPEVDLLVEIANEADGVYGARMTGGGFGGAIVALARPDVSHEAAAKIVRAYSSETGRMGRVISPFPDRGEGAIGAITEPS
jgi:galactokinase